MSILHSSDIGWYVCHKSFINEMYKDIHDFDVNVKSVLFEIDHNYRSSVFNNLNTNKIKGGACKKARKESHHENSEEEIKKQVTFDTLQKEVSFVQSLYDQFRNELIRDTNHIYSVKDNETPNLKALNSANVIYRLTENMPQMFDGGNMDSPTVQGLAGSRYVFPRNCRFFCRDVSDIEKHLNDKYDLILLDPPWWNKYIRRKRKKCGSAYDMMYNDALKNIPVENMLKNDGLIAVWCTNSPQNVTSLCNDIFKKWGVEMVAKWYWIKVTKSGETVCEFSEPLKKQPFEQILFASKSNRNLPSPPHGRIVMSVPSALHSHKPPLTEVLRPYLPENPHCLEVFARYLLPCWTSYGLEVIKWQHESLYDISQKT